MTDRIRRNAQRLVAQAAATIIVGATFVGSPLGPSSPAEAAPGAPTAYVAVQPCRLADTRQAGTYTRVDAQTIQVQARNACGVPAAATAVALTLTVDSPSLSGFLTAWPASQPRPTVSNLNFSVGQIRANGSITRLDAAGAFRVYTSSLANVVVDVVGAFVPASSARAGRFVPRTPTRLFDSRSAGGKPTPGARLTIPLPSGVAPDALALALNVTVTESSAPGFVTQFPAGQTMPTSSILNLDAPSQTRAAAGIFPVSAGGVGLYLSGGGHVVVDVLGYFTGPSASSSTDGLFTAYDPTRLLDTRSASPLGQGVPLYPGGGLELNAVQGGAIAFNLTSVDGQPGYTTAYPAGTERPATSSVNSGGYGDVVANFAITQVSSRGLALFSQARTHALVDVQGWFSGPQAPVTTAPPTNTPPPVPQPAFSACSHDGLAWLNQVRAAVGSPPVGVNANAEAFACNYALQLAMNNNGLVHSNSGVRSAAVGCGTGENIAWSMGTSTTQLLNLWYTSAPHLANMRMADYRGVGIGFVIRTEPSGATSIWGVMDLSLC